MHNFLCDMYIENNIYYIEAEIPGFKKEDISINYDGVYLNIQAERKENENHKYLIKERKNKEVIRHFKFHNIDADLIEAKYNDGILTIIIPNKEVKKNKIEIL